MDSLSSLEKQFRFILEADKLKSIYRQSRVTDKSRAENSAEHSWHLALMAVLLNGYANEPQLDLLRVIKMIVIHDIVEIDAGDTFAYDVQGNADKQEREELAAERLFGLLPVEQRAEFDALWREFELRQTPEAKFAAALDRLQPMLLNYHTDGAAWKKHGITADRVFERNRHIGEGSEVLWQFAQQLIRDAVREGHLSERREHDEAKNDKGGSSDGS